MDNRTLIAFGMLLALVAFALQKRAVDGNAVEKIVTFLSGGITGAMVPRQAGVGAKDAARAVAVFLVVFGMLFLHGCAATGPYARCNPVMVQCNPADYPPITEMLPKSPFPELLQPLPEGGQK